MKQLKFALAPQNRWFNHAHTRGAIAASTSRVRGAFAGALMATLLCASIATAAPGRTAERLLVKPKRHLSEEAVQATFAAHGATQRHALHPLNVRVLHVPEGRLAGVLEALRNNPEIEFVEPDEVVAPATVPNDTYYSKEWHLPIISAPAAWDLTTGSSSVIIAILDTGVDGTHPELAAKMLPGWNFYDNNSDTRDVYGHGTAVAGTAAATSNNGSGVASVAWGCKLLPIRITDVDGYATYSTIANGLTYAADHGARVANVSFRASESSTVASAAQYFQSKGGVVTVAAGNESTFISAADNPYVLTVSATDSSDAIASFSNTGNIIDLAAPGVSLYTTTRGGSYGLATGTSFAAPTVAGAAALVISANPALSGAQVQDLLKQSADDLGVPGHDTSYGYGRLNVYKAVRAALGGTSGGDTTAPTATITSPSAGDTLSGTVTINVDASDSVGVTTIDLYINDRRVATSASAPGVFAWDTTQWADGTYTLLARASDAANNLGASAAVTVNVLNTTAGPDTIAPTVEITSPADGTTVGRYVEVYVEASDDVGVARVELYVDGKLYSSSSSSAPVFNWNTRKLARGRHTLRAQAYDAAGNKGASGTVAIYK